MNPVKGPQKTIAPDPQGSGAVASALQSAAGQRIDQWLWFARLTKSRTLAQALVARGKVRVNRQKIDRASHLLRPGDAVTIAMGPRIRIFTVRAFAKRRGPAIEAQALYEELTPATDRTKPAQIADQEAAATAVREAGAGRPTKRERRQTERLKSRFQDC